MSFEFQLVITEKCNLACKYCYIDQKNDMMTNDIFDKHYEMLSTLMKQHGEDTYHAALFGGEPFLNWNLIEYIIPILKKDPRCTFIIIMTNAISLIDDYKRNYIKKNDISLSISFDGLWNKTNRIFHNGKSSFDKYVEEPLKSFITEAGGSCKVMVSPSCVYTMTENFEWFVDEYGMNSPDFSLVRDDIWSDDDINNYEFECRRLADRVIKYYEEGINANVGFFQLYALDLIFGKAKGKRPFGCFAGCHGAGFMPNGDIYACAKFGSNKQLKIANSNDKIIIKKVSDYFLDFKITNPQTFKKCLKCELYSFCNAGCTYEQIKNVGMYSVPINNVCKLFKITYKETMRITKKLKNNKLYKEMLINIINNVG